MPFTHGWSHEQTINNYKKCVTLKVKSEFEPFSHKFLCFRQDTLKSRHWSVGGNTGNGAVMAEEEAESPRASWCLNTWRLGHDVLFRELFLLTTFSSFAKEAWRRNHFLQCDRQPKSVTQSGLSMEFLTPTPIQPTRPRREASARAVLTSTPASGFHREELWPLH